jgi:hypothetical protein
MNVAAQTGLRESSPTIGQHSLDSPPNAHALRIRLRLVIFSSGSALSVQPNNR